MDKLSNIDEKILRLKKQREKVQLQQAVQFMKEIQKILGEGFSPDIALDIISETWSSASEKQKEEWKKRSNTFRTSLVQKIRQKSQTSDSASSQS